MRGGHWLRIILVVLQLQVAESGWVKVWEEVDSMATLDLGADQTNAMFAAGGGVMRYDIKGETYAYFRRLTAPDEFDAHSIFTDCWSTAHHGQLNVDFELFSSEADLWSGLRKWKFCNADDCAPGLEVGAFRVRTCVTSAPCTFVHLLYLSVRSIVRSWPSKTTDRSAAHSSAGLWAGGAGAEKVSQLADW